MTSLHCPLGFSPHKWTEVKFQLRKPNTEESFGRNDKSIVTDPILLVLSQSNNEKFFFK